MENDLFGRIPEVQTLTADIFSAGAYNDVSSYASIHGLDLFAEGPTVCSNQLAGTTIQANDSSTLHFSIGAQIHQPAEIYALETRFQKIKRSRNAEYNMTANSSRGPCTPDTRTAVLQKLLDWCFSGEALLYWMSGMAGIGKTTITFSLCETLKKFNLLGASFFCSRSLPDCRDIKLIISTIAFQLARSYAMFAEALATALAADPDIFHRGLDDQLRTLIVEPWTANQTELPERVVIVIDALDECDEDHAKFIQLLFNNVATLPFKILITSRPEPSIRDVMKAKDPTLLSSFILHEVEDDIVRADILKYLEFQLADYTTPAIINRIADLSGSLFIYAATLAKLCISGKFNILARLQILQESSPTEDRFRMLAPLDELYKGVFAVIFSDDLLDIERQEITNILGTVVCAREPLSRRIIAELWGIEEPEVDRQLGSLSSIIVAPRDPCRPITVLHASLPDFLLDPSRSGRFHCEPADVNLRFTKRCLALMARELRPNLCQLSGRPPNDSIPSHLLDTSISVGLQYATTYVVEHWSLSNTSGRQAGVNLILPLFTSHVLCWFECLSLLRRLAISIPHLELVLRTLEKETALATLVYDSLRLIQHSYDIVKDSAMEIHFSALTWVPIRSSLRSYYSASFTRAPHVLCGSSTIWTGPEREVKIYSPFETVTSIAISEDGQQIVSGSSDKTLRIWNMRTQTEECILRGHTEWINSVAISRDGSHIVSGSDDETIRIWSPATRLAVLTVNASSPVLVVSLSSNEQWIASGHKNYPVRIWDARSGALLHSLEHEDWVTSIKFLPNDSYQVLLPTGIWNVHSGKLQCTFHGHISPNCCAAHSPDGNKIVTGSHDNTARLWDTSGHELQVFRGHLDWVRCVAFLLDGKRVVTGSKDKTLRVWETTTGNTVHTFTDANEIESIAMFPDGLRIASSSGSSIGIWSMRGEVEQAVDRSPPSAVATHITFSSNGRNMLLLPSLRILDTETQEERAILRSSRNTHERAALSASGSRAAVAKWVIEVWVLLDEGRVGNYHILEGHTAAICSISFSYDEQRVLSFSYDKTVRVWDVVAGTQLHVFAPRSPVYYGAFSHGKTKIVASNWFNIKIWDMHSGVHLPDIYSHAESTVSFTPDDQHVIVSSIDATNIYNALTGELEAEHANYHHWTTLDDASSYAFRDDWVYRVARLGDQPQKVLKVPSQYRPPVPFVNVRKGFGITGPLFTLCSQGVRACLPRKDGVVTIIIPKSIAL